MSSCGSNAIHPFRRCLQQLAHVEAVEREHTGVGSFTHLRVPIDMPHVPFRVSPVAPFIESPELKYGGGVILFFEYGFASMLEIYTAGDTFADPIREWRLVPSALPAEDNE